MNAARLAVYIARNIRANIYLVNMNAARLAVYIARNIEQIYTLLT